MKPDWLNWPETRTLIAAFAPGELRFVGGALRDALLGRMVTDVDAATTLTPDAVIKKLDAANIQPIPTGIDHGTVTAHIGGKNFEITTLRKDVATDGRHAQVAFTDDWQEDAARRDFTMNALYLSPEGELFDYFGGEADAKAGVVKFIGDANLRIREDYLRILRYFRFLAHYGRTAPDIDALAACAANAEGLSSLSGERIRQEMFKLLAAPKPFETLCLMSEILSRVFGGALTSLEPVEQLQRAEILAAAAPNAIIRLSLLLYAHSKMADHVCSAWKLSNEDKAHLKTLLSQIGGLHIGSGLPEQKKALRALGAILFKEKVLMHWALDGDVENSQKEFKAMLKLADSWQIPQFPVTGKDLQAKGMAEGKILGDTLRELEAAWEASDYTLTKEELLAKIK